VLSNCFIVLLAISFLGNTSTTAPPSSPSCPARTIRTLNVEFRITRNCWGAHTSEIHLPTSLSEIRFHVKFPGNLLTLIFGNISRSVEVELVNYDDV